MPFPFPERSGEHVDRVARLAEELDAHRARRLAKHPTLTLTNLYNVVEKLRLGEQLTRKELETHEQGLCSTLKELHEELDAAVLAAYRWDGPISDAALLERLATLNRQRTAEEAAGVIRSHGNGSLRAAMEAGPRIAGELNLVAPARRAVPTEKRLWPATLALQAQVVRDALLDAGAPVTANELARTWRGAKRGTVAELLETLASLGQARRIGDKFTA